MADHARWALVVIDLQRDLCSDPRRREMVDRALPSILELIQGFPGISPVPVIYTKFELEPDDEQFERFGDRYCIRGTPGSEFIDQIEPWTGIVVVKQKHSAFFKTDLDSTLTRHGATGVVLAGLQTQICVLTTAADAYQRGYRVIVAHDAVVSTRDEVRLDAINWIERYVGEARAVKEILACS